MKAHAEAHLPASARIQDTILGIYGGRCQLKRSSARRADLPPFRIDIAELSVLIDRVIPLFEKPRIFINVEIGQDEVTLNSIDEFPQVVDLPAELTKFSISILEDIGGLDRHVFLRSSKHLTDMPWISVDGESEAWAAGVIETVKGFFARHRAPLHWFMRLPIGLIAFGASICLCWVGYIGWKDKQPISWSWVAALLAILAADLVRNRLSPSVIATRRVDGSLTRWIPQIGLAVAFGSLVIAVLAWLFPRAP